jgi:AraC-like DNA-binding protein
MSERTLARKLSDEGLNFTEILQQLRRDLAVRYLDDRKLHVSKIAWLLGFHEVSAFTNAFKCWTGKPPSQDADSRRLLSNVMAESRIPQRLQPETAWLTAARLCKRPDAR